MHLASIIGQSFIIIIVECSLIFVMCSAYHSLLSFIKCITELCMLYVNVLFHFVFILICKSFLKGKEM